MRNEDRESIEVCATTFRSILNVSDNRIARIARDFYDKSKMPAEKRGSRSNFEKDEEHTQHVQRHILKYNNVTNPTIHGDTQPDPICLPS